MSLLTSPGKSSSSSISLILSFTGIIGISSSLLMQILCKTQHARIIRGINSVLYAYTYFSFLNLPKYLTAYQMRVR